MNFAATPATPSTVGGAAKKLAKPKRLTKDLMLDER
jgi:hypothetical protein